METAVIFLGGGNSCRMNYPKAFLKIDNSMILENNLNTYSSVDIKKKVIILNQNLFQNKWLKNIRTLQKKATLIQNNFPDLGRSYSIYLGLKQIEDCNSCFIQNVDNPEISEELLIVMKKSISENSYVVPVHKNKAGHPILISKTIIEYLIKKENFNWILKDELKKFHKKLVPIKDIDVTLNINTPDDFEKYIMNKKRFGFETLF